jgi:hypothetical protein
MGEVLVDLGEDVIPDLVGEGFAHFAERRRRRRNDEGVELVALEGRRNHLGELMDKTVLGDLVPIGRLHGALVGGGVIGPTGAVGALLAGGGILLPVAADERELRLGGAALVADEQGAGAVCDEDPGAVLERIQWHGEALFGWHKLKMQEPVPGSRIS